MKIGDHPNYYAALIGLPEDDVQDEAPLSQDALSENDSEDIPSLEDAVDEVRSSSSSDDSKDPVSSPARTVTPPPFTPFVANWPPLAPSSSATSLPPLPPASTVITPPVSYSPPAAPGVLRKIYNFFESIFCRVFNWIKGIFKR